MFPTRGTLKGRVGVTQAQVGVIPNLLNQAHQLLRLTPRVREIVNDGMQEEMHREFHTRVLVTDSSLRQEH